MAWIRVDLIFVLEIMFNRKSAIALRQLICCKVPLQQSVHIMNLRQGQDINANKSPLNGKEIDSKQDAPIAAIRQSISLLQQHHLISYSLRNISDQTINTHAHEHQCCAYIVQTQTHIKTIVGTKEIISIF